MAPKTMLRPKDITPALSWEIFEGFLHHVENVGVQRVSEESEWELSSAEDNENILRDFLHLHHCGDLGFLLWDNLPCKTVVESSDVFHDTPLAIEDFGIRPQFWFFRHPYRIDPGPLSLPHEDHCVLGVYLKHVAIPVLDPNNADFVLVTHRDGFEEEVPSKRGLGLGLLVTDQRKNLRLRWTEKPRLQFYEHGCFFRFLPALVEGEPVHWWYSFVVAGLAFLKTKILVDKDFSSRQVRRQAKRKGKTVPPVRVVTLRKALPSRSPKSGDKDGTKEVDWSCRWLVSGHFRKQPYPKEGVCRPIFIEPYVKGPEDKPFRPPRPTVHHTKR